MSDAIHVTDNPQAARFEAAVDGLTAFAAYELEPGAIRFTHTIVPAELEGRGIGSALARTALDAARARGLCVVPQCAFIHAYIQRHPAYQDLVGA